VGVDRNGHICGRGWKNMGHKGRVMEKLWVIMGGRMEKSWDQYVNPPPKSEKICMETKF